MGTNGEKEWEYMIVAKNGAVFKNGKFSNTSGFSLTDFGGWKDCVLKIKVGATYKEVCGVNSFADVEEGLRNVDFSEVDKEAKKSYFPNDSRLVDGENEVIRLENAISAISESLKCAPKFHPELGKGRKVRVGEAMLFFAPVRGPKWVKWCYILSGVTLSLAGSVVKGAVAFYTGVVGKIANDLSEIGEFMRNDTIKYIGDLPDTILAKIGQATGFISRKDIEAKIKIDRDKKNIVEYVVTHCIIGSDAHEKIGNAIRTVMHEKVTSVSSKLGLGGNGNIVAIIDTKNIEPENKRALSIVEVAADVALAAYSELPFIYQMTDSLFLTPPASNKPGENYSYASETDEATYGKFGAYAAVVEDMVNKKILGWELKSWRGREVKKICKCESGYSQYFADLKISAKEISDAIEILDESISHITYIDDSGNTRAARWPVGVEFGGGRNGRDVEIVKNEFGALRVQSDDRGGGVMRDYDDDSVRKEWITYASNAKGVIIKESVIYVGNCAFKDCIGLLSVTIRNGVKSIGEEAFCGCAKLKSITIPASVSEIGYGAFRGCSQMSTIVLEQQDPSKVVVGGSSELNIEAVMKETFPKNVKLYVPKGNGKIYKTHSTWKYLNDRIEERT
jgi:hypothetical protein